MIKILLSKLFYPLKGFKQMAIDWISLSRMIFGFHWKMNAMIDLFLGAVDRHIITWYLKITNRLDDAANNAFVNYKLKYFVGTHFFLSKF